MNLRPVAVSVTETLVVEECKQSDFVTTPDKLESGVSNTSVDRSAPGLECWDTGGTGCTLVHFRHYHQPFRRYSRMTVVASAESAGQWVAKTTPITEVLRSLYQE